MGTPAMGTGTWQQQPSANGCQVPVPWQGCPLAGGLEGLDDAAADAG
jgi:hypothetical protein